MLNLVKENINNNESEIKYRLFTSLLTDSFVLPESINSMLNQLGVRFSFFNYFVTAFYLTKDCKDVCEKSGYNVENLDIELENIIENQCKRITPDYVTFTNIDHSVVILVVENLSSTSNLMINFYESTLNIIRSRYNINIIVGKSDNYHGLEKFRDAFWEAFQQALKKEYYGFRETYIDFGIVPNEMFMEKKKSLIKSIKACDLEKANLIIDLICNMERRMELPLKQIKTMNAIILNGIVTILSEINCDNVNNSMKDIFEEMNAVANKIKNFENSKQVLRETTYDVIKIIEKYNLEKNKRRASLIFDFIDKNYSRDIMLCEMAKKFNTDCVNLSKTFKEDFGENFSQYLIKFRIKKAKEMLCSTNLKVYEISKNIGYCDVKYFTQLFKKFEGVTPNEYRKNQNKY